MHIALEYFVNVSLFINHQHGLFGEHKTSNIAHEVLVFIEDAVCYVMSSYVHILEAHWVY